MWGSKGNKIINLKNDRRTKKFITQINNSDNLSCPQCIVTALTYHLHNSFERYSGEYNENEYTLEDIAKLEKM